MSGVPPVHGYVAPGLEGVREAFDDNFRRANELGAAFCAMVDGTTVVDLWGGTADASSGRPWSDSTCAVIFSGTKALVAFSVLKLAERGSVDIDAPVSRYWPEFGKDHITVSDVMAHRARLPGITETTVTFDDFANPSTMTRLLAAQKPFDDVRARACYHPFTYGWLAGEVVRRTDGRSVGTFFREEIANPLQLDAWIGAPPDAEPIIALLDLAPDWPQAVHLQPSILDHDDTLKAIWTNPPVFDREFFPWNDRTFHAAEIPGAGGISSARSMAKLYDAALRGLVISPETLRWARQEQTRVMDHLLQREIAHGIGFQIQAADQVFGPPSDGFGHAGAGGSVHGAWPTQRVGFSYVMNRMRDDSSDDRASTLLRALYEALSP